MSKIAAFEFTNGQKVKDKITGFVGVITGRADYATGPNRYCLETLGGEGDVLQEWFDEERLEGHVG